MPPGKFSTPCRMTTSRQTVVSAKDEPPPPPPAMPGDVPPPPPPKTPPPPPPPNCAPAPPCHLLPGLDGKAHNAAYPESPAAPPRKRPRQDDDRVERLEHILIPPGRRRGRGPPLNQQMRVANVPISKRGQRHADDFAPPPRQRQRQHTFAGRSHAVHRLFGPDQLVEEGDHVRLAVQIDAVKNRTRIVAKRGQGAIHKGALGARAAPRITCMGIKLRAPHAIDATSSS